MSKTVLIVEDDDTIRENLKDILELESYAVIEARHGKEAIKQIELLAGNKMRLPHAILLDLNMPIMSGRDFLISLQSRRDAVAQIPVVVMTATPEAVIPGTFAFLRKPIDLDRLLEVLTATPDD